MTSIARRLRVNGTVQGVGFRPFVFVLAQSEGLNGTVLNDGQGVEIVLEGPQEAVDRFVSRLQTELPPLAAIETLSTEPTPWQGLKDFSILRSRSNAVSTVIPADAAVCESCLRELTDEHDRRYRYPFINCTHCGPRYTITAHLPYDRPQTSMRDFPMCSDCLTEYEDPLDRRFHAQPNACPECGPEVVLLDRDGTPVDCDDPIAALSERIRSGEIVAVKGLGGFHLVCDARNPQAIEALRERKHRPSKPFAVMGLNPRSLASWVVMSEKATEILKKPQAPILLLPKQDGVDETLPGIAPKLNHIGVMLPYTPIHWLIFFEYMGRPQRKDWFQESCDLCLVMTSANAGGEPLVIDNVEAVQKLKGICDAYLVHNRDILIRCDDSVAHMKGEDVQLIRRARGFVPRATTLKFSAPSVVATGAWLKNTACLTKGNHAYLTQHIGDLDRVSNDRTLEKAIDHLAEVFEITPEIIACDLHPDFYSTVLAEKLADRYEARLVAVQHHHAHIASVMAEHQLCEPVLGLALDGVGLGSDGRAWGGELLRVDPAGFTRLASLAPIKMPGGDKCAREGWRMAYALLAETGEQETARRLFPFKGTFFIERLLESDLPIPESSSLGRLFDTAAALTGLKTHSSYEGEAPVILQAASEGFVGRVRSDLVSFGTLLVDEAELEGVAAETVGDGFAPNGIASNGNAANGDASNGDAPNGNAANGDALEVEAPRGETAEDNATKRVGRRGERNRSEPLNSEAKPRRTVIDFRALLSALVHYENPGQASADFHETLAAVLAQVTIKEALQQGIKKICLSGGCCLNTRLTGRLRSYLEAEGLSVYEALDVPPNDGGLSLGQAWVVLMQEHWKNRK